MKKIYFDDDTFIWKTKLNMINHKSEFLKEAHSIIESLPEIKNDGFGYKQEWKNDLNFMGEVDIKTRLDEIIQIAINACKKLYEETNTKYNKINVDTWVNVVRAKNPVQRNFKNKEDENIDKYHTHTDLSVKFKRFKPTYTYVYYIQMPDVMNEEDGVLYFKGKNEKEYWIRPEEDDLIIMPADMPHSPNDAPNSTQDRIVFAGNIGFEMFKKEKSLI
jgi:cupin superfamily acireductone dioxygenase involved in methionine salvage